MLSGREEVPYRDEMERARMLDASEWEAHRGSLAEALDDDAEFDLFASFYYSVGQLRERLVSVPGGTPLGSAERNRTADLEVQARVFASVVLEQGSLPVEWVEERARLLNDRLERARELLDEFELKPRKGE